MLNGSFSWNGTSSESLGLYIKHKEIYKAPTRSQEILDIPGKDSIATLDNGIYDFVTVEYQLKVKNVASKLAEVAEWLSAAGKHKLTDSDDSTTFRLAVRTGEPDWSFLGQGMWAELTVSFTCDPWRYLTSGETKTTLTKGQTLTNPTNYTAMPQFYIARANTTAKAFTLSVNNQSFPFTATTTKPLQIFSDMQVATPAASADFDDFPVLKSGANTISWTGDNVASVAVVPNWRKL